MRTVHLHQIQSLSNSQTPPTFPLFLLGHLPCLSLSAFNPLFSHPLAMSHSSFICQLVPKKHETPPSTLSTPRLKSAGAGPRVRNRFLDSRPRELHRTPLSTLDQQDGGGQPVVNSLKTIFLRFHFQLLSTGILGAMASLY